MIGNIWICQKYKNEYQTNDILTNFCFQVFTPEQQIKTLKDVRFFLNPLILWLTGFPSQL